MGKGIYLQLLSRLMRKRAGDSLSSTPLSSKSSASSSSTIDKYANKMLLFAFSKFKSGDYSTAQSSINKLLKLVVPAGNIHFAAQLCLSIGYLRMKRYEEVVQCLSEVISLCGHSVHGLCDALIILAEVVNKITYPCNITLHRR